MKVATILTLSAVALTSIVAQASTSTSTTYDQTPGHYTPEVRTKLTLRELQRLPYDQLTQRERDLELYLNPQNRWINQARRR